MSMPGPNRSCYVGERLLAELEAAGPRATLPDCVLATMRRVQWDVPPGFRNAGVFVSGDKIEGNKAAGGREMRFAVLAPRRQPGDPARRLRRAARDHGRGLDGPVRGRAELAGPHGTLLDECQLLVGAMSAADWEAAIARARPLAKSPRK